MSCFDIVLVTLMGHRSGIKSLTFHPCGNFIATGSSDTNVKVFLVLQLSALLISVTEAFCKCLCMFMRSDDTKLIIRVINFELVQHICPRYTSTLQTARRTDGRPTISIPRFALRATCQFTYQVISPWESGELRRKRLGKEIGLEPKMEHTMRQVDSRFRVGA